MSPIPIPSPWRVRRYFVLGTLPALLLCAGACSSSTNSSPSDDGSDGGTKSDDCRAANGLAEVVDGTCQIACFDSYANCDGLGSNGCEVNLQDDPEHCGDCDMSCSFEGASAACSEGQCSLGACETSRADCNATPDDGCEIDITTDPFHCGACDQSCEGSACVQGVCGDSAVQLFDGAAFHFTLDETYAYLTFDDSNFEKLGEGVLWRVPKASGEPTVMADGLDTPWSASAEQGTVYWISRGGNKESTSGGLIEIDQSVYRMTGGGSPESVVSSDLSWFQEPLEKLVLGPSFLFVKGWAQVWRASRQGGTLEGFGLTVPQTVPPSMWVDLAVSDGFVYAVRSVPIPDTVPEQSQAEIVRVAVQGGSEELLATAPGFRPVALTVTGDTVVVALSASGADDMVASIPDTGGPVTPLQKISDGGVTALCADSTHVYFPVTSYSSHKSFVTKIALSDGASTVIATANDGIREVAVDDQAVYYLDGFGLWRASK